MNRKDKQAKRSGAPKAAPARKAAPRRPAPAAEPDLRQLVAGTADSTRELLAAMQRHRDDSVALLRRLTEQESELTLHHREIRHLLVGIANALDVFDRQTSAETDDAEALRAAVRVTADQLRAVVADAARCELIGRPGETAHPETHHIVEAVEQPDQAEDTVLDVVRHGVRHRGEVVRPASVITVGKEPSA